MNSRTPARRPAAPAALAAGAATVLALFTALPALLDRAGIDAGVAYAQQPQQPPQADSVTQIARQRYNEGVKAYDAGRFEDARAAFAQAYALKRHPAVLLNLGQSELRSNHHDDAGNHLQQFLREYTAASPDEKAVAQKGIAEAKRKASQVVISVDAAGADVSIDGVTVGKSPFYDPIFIAPGKHTVFATLAGKSAAVAVEAKVGTASQATLTLGILGAVAPPPPPPVSPPPPPVMPPGPPVMPPGPPVTPPGPPMNPPPPVMPPSQEREPFGNWYKRKPLAWVGTGVTGVGLILGIAGGAASLAARSSADDTAAQIKDEIARRRALGIADPANVCAASVLAAQPALKSHYGSGCDTLQSNIDIYHVDIGVAVTGWVLFGVGAAATALYTVIDWYPSRGAPSTGAARGLFHDLAVLPIISPTQRGIGFAGTF